MSDINSEASDVSQLFHITAAHKVAKNDEKFSKWAISVKLDPELLHGEKLPEFLQKQVDDSRLVPTWIFDEDAPEYKYVRRFYPDKITSLAEEAKTLEQLKECPSPDQELSDELESALLDIFRAASQHRYFQLFVTPPTEADCRRPLDRVNDHVWQLEGDTNFLHRMECPVQVPQSADFSFCTVRADSTIFIRPCYPLVDFSDALRRACSSIMHPDTYTHVLHWANEFKRESNELTSKRQAWMAMVSGLYQRRALGFKDHYIYGTAHHSRTQLTVYAGAWDDKAPQGSRLSKDAKIILYELCTFDVLSLVDMVQLYLLMRLSRRLALQHKRLFEEINFNRLLVSLKADKSLDSWPPQRDSRQDSRKSKSTNNGSKKRKVTRVEEEPHDSEALSDCSMTESNSSWSPDVNNAEKSVQVVDVDDSLKHQFADVLSRKGELSMVHGYLASSMHKHYDYEVEEISDQVEGNGECDE